MNILLLADANPSGEWIATRRLIEAIKGSYPSTNIFFAGFCNFPLREDWSLFTQAETIPRSTANSPFAFFRQLYRDIHSGRRVIKKLSPVAIDLILITEYTLVLAIKTMVNLRDKPSVYYFHGLHSLNPTHLRYPSIGERFLFYFEKLALRQSLTIMAPSVFGKRFIRSWLRDSNFLNRTYKIPHGIPAVFFARFSREEKKYLRRLYEIPLHTKIILFVGRLVAAKGLYNLTAAFAKINKWDKQTSLVIVSPRENIDQDVTDHLQQQIHALHLEKKVIFLWGLGLRQLAMLYQISQITLLPSEFEVSPLVLYESLAASTPVLGTATGDMAQLLEKVDGTLILKDNSAAEIFSKLRSYFRLSPKRRRELRQRSRRTVLVFTPERSAQTFMRIINEATTKQRHTLKR